MSSVAELIGVELVAFGAEKKSSQSIEDSTHRRPRRSSSLSMSYPSCRPLFLGHRRMPYLPVLTPSLLDLRSPGTQKTWSPSEASSSSAVRPPSPSLAARPRLPFLVAGKPFWTLSVSWHTLPLPFSLVSPVNLLFLSSFTSACHGRRRGLVFELV